MKAAVMKKAAPIEEGPVILGDMEDPTPGPGQLVMKVTACGVCRSNLHMIEGDWLPDPPRFMPIVPGHEVVGTVAALGEGVTGFELGDRVGVQPLWDTCGTCLFCRSGREQLCQSKEITGETVHGGYAEYMLAEAAFTHQLPDTLDDVSAAPLFCPGITAYGAVVNANLGPAQRVGIFGLGGVGHMALQFAGLTGAETIAVSRGASRLSLAEELGADRVMDSSDGKAGERLLAEGGLDAAIIFAPSDEVAAQAIQAVKPGGRLVVGVKVNVGTIDFPLGKTVVGSLLGTRIQMDEVLRLAGEGRVKVAAEALPLAEAATALKRLKDGDVRGRLVLVP